MRTIKSLLMIGLCLAFAVPALAQYGGGMGRGRGPGAGMGPMLSNPQTVTTIKGVLQAQDTTTRRGRLGVWVVKTDQGDLTVHLGPAWYLSQQQVVMNPGAAVEITGSRVDQGGQSVILAREITAAGKTVKLRDDQGLPLWRGQGRMPPR